MSTSTQKMKEYLMPKRRPRVRTAGERFDNKVGLNFRLITSVYYRLHLDEKVTRRPFLLQATEPKSSILRSVLKIVVEYVQRKFCERYRTNKNQTSPELKIRSARFHNYTRSALHNLPAELILDIFSYLSPIDRLITQRVCSKFRNFLAIHGVAPEIKDFILTERERYQFQFLLRRHREVKAQNEYDQSCELALPGSQFHRLGCSGCRLIHEKEQFSEHQLHLPPELRICKGLENRIRLCEHYSFSGQCLLRGLREMGNVDVFCRDRHKRETATDDIDKNLHLRLSKAQLGIQDGQNITIDRRILLFEIASDEPTTYEAISSELAKVNSYICPHLRSGSSELFHGERVDAECPRVALSEILDNSFCSGARCHGRNESFPGEQLRLGTCVVWFECSHEHCYTRYALRRIHTGFSQHSIALEVSCDIFGGPTHPSWQAHISPKWKDQNGNNEGTGCNASFGKCTGECCLYQYNEFIMKI